MIRADLQYRLQACIPTTWPRLVRHAASLRVGRSISHEVVSLRRYREGLAEFAGVEWAKFASRTAKAEPRWCEFASVGNAEGPDEHLSSHHSHPSRQISLIPHVLFSSSLVSYLLFSLFTSPPPLFTAPLSHSPTPLHSHDCSLSVSGARGLSRRREIQRVGGPAATPPRSQPPQESSPDHARTKPRTSRNVQARAHSSQAAVCLHGACNFVAWDK